MNDFTPMSASSDKLLHDFRSLATHAEQLLRATAEVSGETVANAREKLGEQLKAAREELGDLQGEALERARRMAATADTYVHERPWPAIAAALAVGVLIGYAATPSRH
jgi:ElaB/YqjD/DUF883 family membrane-anchored ribosome-binding protein